MSNQIELTKIFKNAVKSYNVNINTDTTGTFVDIDANATSAVATGVISYADMVYKGCALTGANEFMLEQWAISLGLVRRKTGSFASGVVRLDADPSKYPINVAGSDVFTLGELRYTALVGQVATEENPFIEVQAQQIGAEYNIKSGIVLESTLGDGITCVSEGIGGGAGVETLPLLRQRISTNIKFRRTNSQASDFTQFALENYPYAESTPLLAPDLETGIPFYPIGVNVMINNTIQDYDLASRNTEINEVAASQAQLDALQASLQNFKNCVTYTTTSTIPTQVVSGLKFYFTSTKTYSYSGINEIIEVAVRKSLLQFQGTVLFPHSLQPELPNDVTSYYFNEFPPIPKTSLQMDSLTIEAYQYNL